MGYLRLWLAVAVLSTHYGSILGYRFLDAQLAVQAFYVISGFYMGLVLDKKYGHEKQYFWFNRFVRIYPVFIFTLLASLAWNLYLIAGVGDFDVVGHWMRYASQMPFSTRAILYISNFLIEGRDLLCFTAFNPGGTLHFVKSNGNLILRPNDFVFLSQGWTLSMESWFYLLAPFLFFRRLRYLWLLFGLSTLARFVGAYYGLDVGMWRHAFFPFELAWFIAGMIAYRLQQSEPRNRLFDQLARFAPSLFLVELLSYAYLDVNPVLKDFVLLILLALSVPKLFQLGEKIPGQTFVGQMSYPLYICQVFVFGFVHPLGLSSPAHEGEMTLVLTLILSVVLVWSIERPVSRWRSAITRSWREAKLK